MDKPPSENRRPSTSPPQWSLWALLMTTAVIAAWLGAWSFHFLTGFMATLLLLPASIVFGVTQYLHSNAERATSRTVGIFFLLGATLPPPVALTLNPFGTIPEIASRLLGFAFFGGFFAVAYAGYVLLMARVLEALFVSRRKAN